MRAESADGREHDISGGDAVLPTGTVKFFADTYPAEVCPDVLWSVTALEGQPEGSYSVNAATGEAQFAFSGKYAVKSFTKDSQDGRVWKMELEKPLDPDLAGLEIYAENATRNPEIHIHDNHFGSGNRARGILVTSPRKTVIEDNLFESSGAAILIEGDLNYWYESGGVSDVLIRRNVFSHCRTSPWGAAVIALTPSTSVPGYHSGVIVTENQFILDPGAEPLFSVDSSAVRFASDNMIYRVSSGQSL